MLESWLRAATVPAGLAWRARIVLLAAQGVANSRIAQAVGVSVPTVVSWRRRYQARGCAGAGGRAPLGVSQAGASGAGRGRYLGATAQEVRGHALVKPAAGPSPGHRQRHRGAGVAQLWDPALEVGDLQVLHRPRAGCQGHRRGGPVPGAPGQRRSAVRRREVPDPGPGPHRPDAAHAAGQDRGGAPTSTPGTEPPPCSPPWRSPPATSQPPASPATAVPSCSSSCTRSRVPTPTTSCGLLGVFRTVLVFLLQAAFFRSRKSRSTSFGARYPRAE